MEFSLLNKKIDISDGRKNYMKILSDYKNLAWKAKQEFKKDYDDTFGMTIFSSSYAEKFSNKYAGDKLTHFVMKYVKETKKYLTKYGIYNLPDKDIWAEVSAERHGISYLQARIEDFIIEYGHLNDQDIVPKIKANFESGYFESALSRDIMALCDFVTNYIDKNNIAEIQFVYEKDVSEAETIFGNLVDGNISIDEQENFACKLIELDPRNEEFFEYIFETFKQSKYEISAIANYLSIDLLDLIEDDIERSFDFNTISCEDDALKMMIELKKEMKKYGITEISKKDELEQILHSFDIKARTYDDVLYETRELRRQAESDDHMLDDLCGEIDNIDKIKCLKLVNEIETMKCILDVKSKHLQKLRERIVVIDKEYLQYLFANIDACDEKECNKIKETIIAYDTTEDIKAPFLSQVDEYIYKIWDKEDYEIFSKLYMELSVSDVKEIEETKNTVLNIGRTQTKELFIKALLSFTKSEIETAAKYAVAKESGLFSSIINMGKKEVYETLTLNGRLMHPAILEEMEVVKAQKGNSLFSGLGLKKKPFSQATKADSNSHKFCSSCGMKIENISKFCSNCGEKIQD